jgi:hypothetical protein
MALHRDIYWIGRQWAVTGHGMQLIDQKLKGIFDIEAIRLWDDGLVESMHAREWLNAADFDKGLAIARARYPQSPGTMAPPPEEKILAAPVIAPTARLAQVSKPEAPKLQEPDPGEPPQKSAGELPEAFNGMVAAAMAGLPRPAPPKPDLAPPKPGGPKFHLQFLGRARFVRPWRVMLKR